MLTEKFLKEKLELESKLKESGDKYLRLQAEFINFQNRTTKEVGDMLKYEGLDFIKAILPTVDDLERAIKMDDNDLSDEVSKFLTGIKIIYGNSSFFI